MRYLVRTSATLTVAAVVVAVALRSHPAPAPAPAAPIEPAGTPVSGDRLPDDWSARVLSYLERMRVPMRGAQLERVLVAVDRSARRFGVDPLTVLAVIEVESRFDPYAVSPKGAVGLMQLRMDTARELADRLGIPLENDDQLLELLLEPEANVLIGTFYLRRLVDRFGDVDAALAAFHAGPTRIASRRDRTGSVPLGYPDRVWDAFYALRTRTLA